MKPVIDDSVLATSTADGTPDTLTLAVSKPGAEHLQTWALVDVGGKQAFPWASIKTRIETIDTILFAMLLYLKFTTFPTYVHFSVPRSNSKH